ncbi:MAG: FtsX-like permease family protein [Clostridia bacterium]|nr:FtsX-like permease family protein [Clostridia bacterium]
MEHGLNNSKNINIGDVLEIDGNQIKIVGSALSTDFLIQNKMIDSRDTSTLGSGKVSFCLFALKDYFDFDYYTAVYVLDEKLNTYNVTSSEYKNALKEDRETLNKVKERLEEEKYKKIIDEANKKIDDEEAKANNELESAKNELDNAKTELDNAKTKINGYEQKLNSAKAELNSGKQKLEDTKKTLDDSKNELDKSEAELKNYEQELNSSKQELDNSKAEVTNVLSKYNITFDEAINSINNVINTFGSKEKAVEELTNHANMYNVDATIVQQITEAVDGILKIEEGYTKIEEGKKELDIQKQNLNTAKETYTLGLQQYNSGYAKYEKNKKEYEKQKNNLNTEKEKYNAGLAEYNKGLEEYNSKKNEVEQKIKDARKELENIEKASFYISDREANYEYSTYMSLCNSFDNLSKSFPIIFFLVAIFISLLSMARMAIENRTEIGTLKALGFTNKEIKIKYILYSILATLIGGAVGGVIGNYALSYLCYVIFNDIYQVPVFETNLNIWAIIIGNLFAVIAIVGSTIMVINRLLKEDATTLLRPISPPIGKKILLEKITPLWKRISFNNKIMARNIFRYKRRVIMSLLGFIGCTSLIMSGYAIKDSMLKIIDRQFIEISDYDQIVNLDGNLAENDLNEIFNYDKIKKLVYVKTSVVEFQENRVTFLIPNDVDNFKSIFNLKDYKTGETLDFKSNEIIITASLAENLNKKVGDELEFVDSNNVLQKFKISAIAENYVENYIYMDKQSYTENADKFFINCAFIKFDSLENTEGIITHLNENEHILTTLSVKSLKDNFKNMLGAFNSIIGVLVVFSALLSFVVMYSLAYITLSERQREIATLKVLGYNQTEIDDYILKEQLNIVIIGIIVGIIAGSLYSSFLINNIKFSELYLVKQIEPLSYIKTAGFIITFTIIVGIGVHYMLKKLKMIESLKSIE